MKPISLNRRFLKLPGLPKNHAKTVLIAGGIAQQYDRRHLELANQLRALDITPVYTQPDRRLPAPVQFHPDMQLCDFGNGHMFVLKETGGSYKKIFPSARIQETDKEPRNIYPNDVLCNCLILGRQLFGKLSALDSKMLAYAQSHGYKLVDVKQGYTGCSSCVINDESVITGDKSIYRALVKAGCDAMLIQPGYIDLPGYNSGFLGGCSGKLSKDIMAFTGSLKNHPDGQSIRGFIENQGISIIELSNESLLDIGGIITIEEAV